jgi:hypothetical protein
MQDIKLTSIPGGHAEDCTGGTLDGGTSNLVAALPDDLSCMQEFGTTGRWVILTEGNGRKFAIVPFLGDGPLNERGKIQAASVGRTVCSKVLAIFTAIHIPVSMLIKPCEKMGMNLHVVCEDAAVGYDLGRSSE